MASLSHDSAVPERTRVAESACPRSSLTGKHACLHAALMSSAKNPQQHTACPSKLALHI